MVSKLNCCVSWNPSKKQLRVRSEWQNLTKTKGIITLQFKAEWEQIHADLEEIGLGINRLEKFLAYIVKVGSPISETVRMDRRSRSDGAGGTTTGLPETYGSSAMKFFVRSKV